MEYKIALLGTGLMGFPMSQNLLKAGFHLSVWNRTKSKATPLKHEGAFVCETIAEAIKDATIIITMLADGPTVEDILFLQDNMRFIQKNAIIIDMGSIPPAMAQSHSMKLASKKINHLDAPVSGGTKGATAANLTIMCGGDIDIFNKALPVFNALGRATYIGPSGTGQLAKCANQVIVGNTIAAISEGLLLAAAGGANPEAVREALMGGFADSRILQEHGKRMLERNFIPGGMCKTQLKDLQTALNAVDNINLPITQATTTLYQTMVDNGHDTLDHSALLLELENMNPDYKLS